MAKLNDMKKASPQGSKRLGWQNTTPDGYSVDATPWGPMSESASTYKANSKYVGNQHTGMCNEHDNFGQAQMPNKKGNIGTPQGQRMAPATANKGQTRFSDPDKINMGAGPRDYGAPGRKWMPSAGQNYVGNPDKIQDRQTFNNVGNKDQ